MQTTTTINPNTPITTVARRITRDLNAEVCEVTVWYDLRTGKQVDAHSSSLHYVHTPEHLLDPMTASWSGYKNTAAKATQRSIQDTIDAHTWATEHYEEEGFEGWISAVEWYLNELDGIRWHQHVQETRWPWSSR